MLALDKEERDLLWLRVVEAIERYQKNVDSYPVAPQYQLEDVRRTVEALDFNQPLSAIDAVDFAVAHLTDCQVHTPHAQYFGLFNPAPTTMGIAADALVAAFNPQLAAGSHSPFAVEVERHLVKSFGERFGYSRLRADGTFTSGGQEANATALIAALNHHFPQLRLKGLNSLAGQPVFYMSAEAHHSFLKAAICAGLGANAVRTIAVDDCFAMETGLLARQIKEDKERGLHPFMIVATAGSTSTGAIDPLSEILEIAERNHLWLHVDAAWGGACVLLPELKGLLESCRDADSITFDCHKWLSVPMAAGMFLTKHPDVLDRTFRVSTAYMPVDDEDDLMVDPFARSLQWSRRFTGLKVLLSLAVAGWQGYAQAIRHQVEVGSRLRAALAEAQWKTVNDTPLPVVCFTDDSRSDGSTSEYLERICAEVVASGQAWISTTKVGAAQTVLRACITNYRTGSLHIDKLIQALASARRRVGATAV